jgi:hypothetical protein
LIAFKEFCKIFALLRNINFGMGYSDCNIVIKNTKELVAILAFASLINCINKNNLQISNNKFTMKKKRNLLL